MFRSAVPNLLSKLPLSSATLAVIFVFSHTEPVKIDATAPINDYVTASGNAQRAVTPNAPSGNTYLSLPSTYVYSPSGDLVYQGGGSDEDTVKNLAMLRGLPETAEHLAPIKNTPKLKDMLELVPEYKAHEGVILGDGHYVVYVATVELGHVTKTQQAVADLRARVTSEPVDTLLLRLQR